MSLNPSSPVKVGPLEWFPLRQRGFLLEGSRQVVAEVTPDDAVTAGDVSVYVASVVGTPTLSVEVLPLASVSYDDAAAVVLDPTGDTEGTAFKTQAGSSAPADRLAALSDDSEATYVLNDSSTLSDYAVEFDDDASELTGKRILSVTVLAQVSRTSAITSAALKVTAGGVDASEAFSPGTTPAWHSMTLATNPETGQEWQPTDFAAANVEAGAEWEAPTSAFRIHELEVRVQVVDEARVASGSGAVTAAGWVTIDVDALDGSDTWGLTADTAYGLAFYVDDGHVVLRGLDSGDAHPAGFSTWLGSLTDDGVPGALGEEDTAALALRFADAAGVPIPAVTQSYESLETVAITSAASARQGVTLPDTESRGWMAFVARLASTATTEPLIARLHRTSDDTQIGGDVTVEPFDVRNAPRLPTLIEMPAASSAAGSAAAHYIEWSTDDVHGWELTGGLTVGTLDEPTELLSADEATFEAGDGWTNGAGASGSRTNDPGAAHSGSYGRRVFRGSGTGDISATTPTGSSGKVVTPGQTINASGWIRSSVNARTAVLSINWYTAAGALVSTSTVDTVTTSTSAWTEWSGMADAPATAERATLVVTVQGAASGVNELHHFDDMSMAGVDTLTLTGGPGQATVDGEARSDLDIPVLVGRSRTAPAGQAAVAS